MTPINKQAFFENLDELEKKHLEAGELLRKLKIGIGLRLRLDIPLDKAARFSTEGIVPPLMQRNPRFLHRCTATLVVTELDGTLIARTPLKEIPSEFWPV